ncbi:MAG: glycosyltransferase [Caldilineaceae bacterium]|nr:glycosyltransferase [Caldilineaceae bacterium]
MNILLLTPQLPFPPRQGTTIRNFSLIKALAARHTIDLITFLAPGEELGPDNPLHQLCREIACVAQPARPTIRRARDLITTVTPDMGLRLESPAMHTQVQAWAGERHYDIVQVEGIELAQYGMAIAGHKHGRQRPALLFDNHNCEYLLQQRNALTDLRQPRRWIAAAYSLIQWRKLRRYEATILRTADATVAVSEADRLALEKLAPEVPVTVVSNGIDIATYRPDPNRVAADPPTLVFTGKMDYRPNIDAVLWFGREVLPLIVAREPHVRFQIVGMNPDPRLDILREQPQIEITGAVEDTRPYIHKATAYIIPMRVGGGTRFKALEAMACAAGVVSTRLGVEGIPVHDGQEMLLADTPQDFAAAVLRLLADARTGGELRRQLGERGRKLVVAQYSWEQIVPRLEHVYLQIAGQSGA